MKDITKIVERLNKDIKNEGFVLEPFHTVEEGLQALAELVTIQGVAGARNLFKKYGVYAPEYVKNNLSIFYPLIKDKVEEMEVKKLSKASGKDLEELKGEIAERKKLEALGSNRIIGYARVSTKEQNLGRQLKALKDAGCQYIFEEKQSGKNLDRIGFKRMMANLKAGDTVVIADLTRIARSTADLFKIAEDLKAKGIAIKSIKESWLNTSDDSATAELMFTIMSGLAQFERKLMLERQAEGIAVAKENGVKFGRKLDAKADLQMAIALYKEGKYTTQQIADMCNISRTTLWRNLKKLGLLE
ncbi:recombinase family protein [uncultured Clostridium sp.]|uniref:recombinase family protein n=1 Tax=uncultured Clostridium sp. TaxID=59620 RepID=UPI0026F3ABC1|nr:recombinase family protein [uncultured Clostridium sp.]